MPKGDAAPEAPSAPEDDLAARIDPIFAEWDRLDSPGCSVAVIREGRIDFERGYGMANLEHGIPNSPTTVFDIGSTSKQFTATCVALLAQDGRLSLDDDIRDFVPEIPDYGRKITIRHLLHHTSGLRDYLTLFALAGIATEDLTTDDDALSMLARQKELNFAPGEEHLYSNSGYFLLSVIVKRAAGRTLAELARERIFDPLRMSSTHIHDDHGRIVPRRATGYSKREKGGFAIDMSDFEQTGDGAVMTTVEDLALWDANFFEARVGGQALLDTLRTRGKLNDGRELDYALGLAISKYRGVPCESHGGSWAGYRAELLRFPRQRTSVIVLCNLGDMNPSRLARKVADVVLANELGPEEERKSANGSERQPETGYVPPDGPSPEQMKELVGAYESEELAVVYEIAPGEKSLSVGVRGKPKLPLVVKEKDTFLVGGARVSFQRDAEGRVKGFTIDAGRVRNIGFARR